jgi:hypothetical protein
MERPTKPETEIQEVSANYKVKRFLTSYPLLHFKAKGKRLFFKMGTNRQNPLQRGASTKRRASQGDS